MVTDGTERIIRSDCTTLKMSCEFGPRAAISIGDRSAVVAAGDGRASGGGWAGAEMRSSALSGSRANDAIEKDETMRTTTPPVTLPKTNEERRG